MKGEAGDTRRTLCNEEVRYLSRIGDGLLELLLLGIPRSTQGEMWWK